MIAGYIIAVSFVILGIYDRVFDKKTIDEEIKVISVGKYDPNACVDLSCGEHFLR